MRASETPSARACPSNCAALARSRAASAASARSTRSSPERCFRLAIRVSTATRFDFSAPIPIALASKASASAKRCSEAALNASSRTRSSISTMPFCAARLRGSSASAARNADTALVSAGSRMAPAAMRPAASASCAR
ncbi:MAG: hypothetical protein IT478_16060, partial [Xanthomonadales bacterium]|nr:hypothetical protein [Xanthomonadales bacterium]